jgi:pyruvate/2-oxoglutarate/acetoin dehydrogenase E1 component
MSRVITFREAVREALAEELRRDEDVYLLGEDIGKFGGTNKVTLGLLDEFGEKRIRNTPISEAAIVGAAVGSAMTGLRPVAEIMFVDFIGVCFDQIMNQAAKLRYMTGGQVRMPMVIRTPGGAGRSSAAQHAQSLEALFCHVPGLLVVQPSNGHDAKGLLKSAIRDDNPVVFVEHKLLYDTKSEVPEEEYTIPLGRADIKREGTDVTVVASSRMVRFSLEAAESLASQGIEAEVIDPMSLVPLDVGTIVESVKKTNRLLIVHEAVERQGIGAEIASVVGKMAFDYLDAPIERLGARNTPVPFAPVLENYVIPDAKKIEAKVIEMLG